MDTDVEGSAGSAGAPLTFTEVLRRRAREQPDQVGYTFLVDGEVEEARLTYGELDRRARSIAAVLQGLGAAGARALLVYPPGLDYVAAFFGCLYAGTVAVPAYPPRPGGALDRLAAIVADARATVALTTAEMLANVRRRSGALAGIEAVQWLPTDAGAGAREDAWQEPALGRETVAYLQYTSGSTSVPRGVVLTHGNLLRNSALIRACFEHTPESRGVVWLPPYHDMGLIGGILQPLYSGFPVTLLSPAAFLQRPLRWLQAVSRARATTSGGPDFAYQLCVRRVPPEQRAGLDLGSWSVAFNGGEPVRAETLERFAEAFGPYGFRREAFYPCYGLAEGTLMVSGGRKAAPPVVRAFEGAALEQGRVAEAAADGPRGTRLVGCGQALPDHRIVIVDPEASTRCPPGRVGEIWMSGPSVAQGYWHRPEETQHAFGARLADTGEGPFLRTGDLGFLKDGELFVTGRLKDLIVLRGRNYYPQDIELTVERSHPALRPGCGAAFSVEVAGEERLVVVQEVDRRTRRPDVEEVARAIRQAVADQHDLAVHAVVLIRTGNIPKTSSGKIRRHACRARFLAGNLAVVGASVLDVDGGGLRPPSVEAGSPGPARSPVGGRSVEALRAWLVSRIADRAKLHPHEVDVRAPFARYGLDSVAAVSLTGELEEWLGRRLSPAVVYEHPTIDALARYLAGKGDGSAAAPEQPWGGRSPGEPIAILGVACRFPGARDAEAFWRLLRDGVDAITEVPAARWDLGVFYDSDPAAPGKMSTRWGGFLEQVDQFDPRFFGISPREAARIDPQQRLLLEVAWEALEDAGQVPDRLTGTQTGVFVGISTNDYGRIQLGEPDLIDAYAGTGNALSIAANRLSYQFGFRGPSVAVDTACSSSLVALHLACRSLASGESTLALAGGVNLILSPAITINFTKAGVMAPDGRCKTFDARANGYVRGEGAGLVVLKPLSRALADGDPVYAVIRGSVVNHDGRTNGLMAPSRQAQEALLREAHRVAGVSPRDIQYVEAHGTGTSLGDAIEASALGAVFAADYPAERRCAIGSVKTNIGHLEAAAGVAGLIKVALSLEHRAIPPSLHFRDPNPNIPFGELPLQVQQVLTAWPAEPGQARAGVSSFGFGGTNAHVVVEEAPRSPAARPDVEPSAGTRASLLPLSAGSPDALRSLAQACRDRLASNGPGAAVSVEDLCRSASLHRSHHDHRLALVARSTAEVVERLEAFVQGEARPGLSVGCHDPGRRRKLVFVFPGQGGQWPGMGRGLIAREPVFRSALERCDRLMRRHVAWSVLSVLTDAQGESRLDDIDVIQPTLFAVQVALAALWRSWGIVPDAVVGHSLGEVAAAHVAGALSLDDAVRVICSRSRLLKRMRGRGAMAVVELSLEQARALLAGYEDRLAIAASNSPASTVLSGDPEALEEVLDRLRREDLFCSLVKVDVASHSPQMDPLRRELLEALEGLRPGAPALPLVSTVAGVAGGDGGLDGAYWWRNLREPVLFSAAVQQAVENGHELFLEIGPHPILSSAIQQSLHHLGRTGTVLPSLRREEEERAVLLGSLGALYVSGLPVDWRAIAPPEGRFVRLPSYPWQRERCWLEIGAADGRAHRERAGQGRLDAERHPLLGRRLRPAHPPGVHYWETELDRRSLPYLEDHRIQGAVLLPGTVYLEMALAAAREAFGAMPRELAEVEFQQALVLPEGATRQVQVVLSQGEAGEASFRIYSRPAGADHHQDPWTLHATGRVRHDQVGAPADGRGHVAPEEVQGRCPDEVSGPEYYRELEEHGYQYGPRFRGVERLWRREGEAVGRVRLPVAPEPEDGGHQVHPSLLDSCFQVLAAAWPRERARKVETRTYLPIALGRFRVHGRPGAELWSHALLLSPERADADVLEGDVFLIGKDGRVFLEARGLRLKRLEGGAPRASRPEPREWFHEIRWQPEPHPCEGPASSVPPPGQRGSWLILADGGGIGRRLSALLKARGEICILVSPGKEYRKLDVRHFQVDPASPEGFRRLLDDAFGAILSPCRGLVHLWSLEASPGPEEITLDALDAAQALGCGSTLHLVQALAAAEWAKSPRLWLVTSGAQPVGIKDEPLSVAQAPLWGLGRTLAHEHPELRCTMVDLAASDLPEEAAALILLQELLSPDEENQIAWRARDRYVARLAQVPPEALQQKAQGPRPDETVPAVPGQDPFRLEIATPGLLDGLSLRATARARPGPGEIEIQVRAAALNFSDVVRAMGLYPGPPESPIPLGIECAGRVTAVGEGVEGLQVGDSVVALGPFSFGSFVVTRAVFAVPKPARLSFEEATTIPVAFLTAYYALHHLGRMAEGERVLIHAAAGGVGLAAVQLAQRMGATIFATAGSPEKRDFLRSLGIPYVMDSRSLDFAEEVLRLTSGQGVDLVLNSLGGDFIPRSLSTLGAYGRFLEIGKRDIYQNSALALRPFQRNLSFFAIDLDRALRERAQLMASLLREIMGRVAGGTLSPLPFRTFPISEVATAFRFMMQARHIGKLVASLDEREVMVAPSAPRPAGFRPDGTYLITGGLGGLGLSVARWMVEHGARHLVLIGRSGGPAAAEEALEAPRASGARIVVAGADVADPRQLADVLAEVRRSLPPLRGIVHAAGILDDGIVLQLDQERFRSVMAPKVRGAWNLHALTLRDSLDFFVLFSSAASLLGSPGQGNYAAANAFLDALAHQRRSRGLPAVSINWGPWAEVGLAARPGRGGRLALQGFASITPRQGLEALGRLLWQGPAQVGVMALDLDQWVLSCPAARESSLFARLTDEGPRASSRVASPETKTGLVRDVVLGAEPAQRQQVLESYLSEQVARVLGLPASKLEPHQSLNTLGIDSLMAVELRNRIEADLQVAVPVVHFLQEPSVAKLAARALDLLGEAASAPARPAEGAVRERRADAGGGPVQAVEGIEREKAERILARLGDLSDDEVDALLGEMLGPEEGRA